MSLNALRILTLSAMLGGSVFGADSRLADAVQREDKIAVRSLVSDRANITVPQSDGTTALHWAVRHDDLTTADLLIKAGADVKAANRYGLTPIHLAASNGHAAMIEKLLAAGVDANFANPGGETVLMTASRTGNVDAIKLLLARGANVNAKESGRGQTARCGRFWKTTPMPSSFCSLGAPTLMPRPLPVPSRVNTLRRAQQEPQGPELFASALCRRPRAV